MTAFASLYSQENIFTVSQLNHETNLLLANHFISIFIEGEISNLSTPSSGHIYFSLKDAHAQIRCAMFKKNMNYSQHKPTNGKQVIIKARVSLYEPRGDYQLIVEQIEEAGDGLLRRAFEALKNKLLQENLFSDTRKKTPPLLPSKIGIITSPTGAAIKDILTVLKRRFPAIPVIIYPVAVQGKTAKFEISKAIASANQHRQCDVLILARGGGSLEDLWAFNEEIVARTIAESDIPIITGIGHETDFTIADFVADLRAATPSAAAEHAVPDQRAWQAQFVKLESMITQQVFRKLSQHQQALAWLEKRLQQQHPEQKLIRNAQRLDELELRINQVMIKIIAKHNQTLLAKVAQLGQFNPATTIQRHIQQHNYLRQRLLAGINYKLHQLKSRLSQNSQTLHAVSPLATLSRGYALVDKVNTNEIVRRTEQLTKGETLRIRFGQGQITSVVKDITAE